MIVCSCNVLSDRQVRAVVAAGDQARSVGQIYRCLGCSPRCGRCAPTMRALLAEAGRDACGACPLACPAIDQAPANVDFLLLELAAAE
jgi:bacterioferritin-associated ferredoxin